MAKAMDMTGQKINRVTFIDRSFVKHTKVYWKCICECGNEMFANVGAVRSGNTKSCGCLNVENKKSLKVKKHGKIHTRLYRTWSGMKFRCYNKKSSSYKRYGGRGITVCDEWKNDFNAFYMWANTSGYTDNLTIERENVDGNYSPKNCCWIPKEKQSENRGFTIYINIDGVVKRIPEWSEISGVPFVTIYSRYKKGITGKDLISKGVVRVCI